MLPLTTDVTLDDIDNMTVSECRRYAADIDVDLIELLRSTYDNDPMVPPTADPLSVWISPADLAVIAAAGLTVTGSGCVVDNEPANSFFEIEIPLVFDMDEHGKCSHVAVSRDGSPGPWVIDSHLSSGGTMSAARVRDFGAALTRAADLVDLLRVEAN